MSERQLILHIGLGKCGTSSLQAFLAINADKLNALDYYYPELESLAGARSGETTSGNGALLARSLLDEEHFFFLPGKRKLMDLLEAKVRFGSDKSVILSSELFSMLKGNQVSEFIQRLYAWDFHVNVVCYVRRQDHIALSAYIQGLIAGHSSVEKSFEEEVLRVSKRFCYSNLLAPWVQVVGDSRLVLRVFERSQLAKGDVISDFLSVIGLIEEQHSFIQTKELNESLNSVSAYLLYLLRKQIIEKAVMQRFVATLKSLDWGKERGNATLIGAECRRKILAFFDEDNRTVATKWAGKPDGVLFEPLADTFGECDVSRIPDLIDVMPLLKFYMK